MTAQLSRAEIEYVLRHPEDHEWQVQGFGMLRTYFDDNVRLQIWDQRLAVFGNNTVHDHPWNFESTIMAGLLYNQRYRSDLGRGRPYFRREIQPGVGGGSLSEPTRVFLITRGVEVYGIGERYGQQADELHVSRYVQGTVTLLERDRVREKDVAVSMWPVHGVPWVFYEPRPATAQEINVVLGDCLRTWF